MTAPVDPSVADPAAIAAHLTARLPDFGQVDWVAEIGSTNASLLARARSDSAPALPWLLGTRLQTEGRGRAGRPWQNQPGTCLMMSIALAVDMLGHRLPALSPLSGLAATEALRTLAGPAADKIKVKWPNDVLFGEKKLGGILVETTRAREGGGHVLIIGMGLNLTQAAHLSHELERGIADWTEVLQAAQGAQAIGSTSALPKETASAKSSGTASATSSKTATAPLSATVSPIPSATLAAHPSALPLQCDPQALAHIAMVLANSWRAVVAQCSEQGFVGLRERYEAVDALRSRAVNVLEQGKILFQGIACGYDEDGCMLVQTASDGIKPVLVGDVSIRPQQQGGA